MPRGVDRNVPAPDEQEMAKSNNEDLCVVCFREILIFSVGECDHAVCFECSVRMRCLCLQNECPICRKELSKVIFVQPENLQLVSYQELDSKVRSGLFDKKYRICFASHKEQAAYYDLLCHKCSKCNVVVSTFNSLKDHVKKEHDLFFCDICTENLKIFSSERKCYNRQQLSIHRRRGDADDSSMRGHPLCKFCDSRFLDRDELFRHLRREHFFCHFCDADGANQFYPDYPSLRDHFKVDHYLCEEGECEREQFTAAFRTDIDLKAHRMKVHGNSMGKTAYKQTRTLELEFTLAPRNRNNFHGESSRGAGATGRSNRRLYETQLEAENSNADDISNQNLPPPKIDARNEQDFPSLSGTPATFQANLSGLRDISTYVGHAKLKNTTENFPALSKSSEIPKEADKSGDAKQAYSKMAASKKPNSGASTSRQGMIIHVSNRPQAAKVDVGKKPEEFPALGVSNKNKELYNDLSLGHSGVKLSTMPSKYSDLVVNAYESVDPSNFAKVTLIKQTTNNGTKQKSQKPIVPKLDLTDNFPTLGKSESTASTPSWVRAAAKNNQSREYKDKVAPTPDLLDIEKHKKVNHKKPNPLEKEKKKMTASKKEMPNKITSSNDEKRKNGKNRDEAGEQNCNATSANKNKHIAPSPPPGFNKGPPPGFTGVTLNSIARNDNNLTFTSSLGEKYDIHPQNKNVYHAPANMQKRNQALVKSFQAVLKNEAALEQFRRFSQLFRESKYSASAYYEHVKIALGDEFSSIFPEFIALLPDINKQKELFLEHSQQTKTHTKDKRKLHICSTCGQILVDADFVSHSATHLLDNNFPELSVRGKTNTTPVSKPNML